MLREEIPVINRLGLHARAAAKLVQVAGGFGSQITVEKDGESVDAKSILGILLLAAAQGSSVTVICDGSDEAEAMAAIRGLFEDYFGEGE